MHGGEPQGPNIAAMQSAEGHQEAAGEKSGFGLGHSDSIATITEGLKYFFTFFEGAFAAYSNIISSLIDSGILVTLFGKSGNMFGIKFLEKLAEFFSGGGEEGGGGEAPQAEDGSGEHNPDDFQHFNDKMGPDFNDFSNGTHDEGHHPEGQSFSPGPSPHVGDDHEGPALGG